MRSLFAKILLWFFATVLIAFFGFAIITGLSINARDRHPPLARLIAFQLREARHAYEQGGAQELQAFLERFHTIFQAEGVLTDARGRDLVTGEDRSELLHASRRWWPMWRSSRAVVARGSGDGRYWFFMMVPRGRVGGWFFLPEHAFILVIVFLLCYALAFYLTSPLRELQKTLERFGRGDLSARTGSKRRDELGGLARTFDRMADRIKMLVTAERRLLLDISHELRSPLARLNVAVELARSGDDREEALNRIQKEADRLNELVEQLLQVTRAEGDPTAMNNAPVRVDELVKKVIDDCSIEAAAKGCSIRLAPGPAVTVTGDAELLRRAIENVLRNAIRYAPPGTAVEVRQDGATVQVRDFGPGVPEQALPRIFDPFYRVETDRNRGTGGVGLGLSIARRAIELHHGHLRARNEHPGLLVEMELPAAGQVVR